MWTLLSSVSRARSRRIANKIASHFPCRAMCSRSSAAAGLASFPFLRLPGEIRLLIYEASFSTPSSPVVVAITRRRLFDSSLAIRKDDLEYSQNPLTSFPAALLRTNKQVYSEALSILYKNIIFFPSCYDSTFLVFLKRLSCFALRDVRRVMLSPATLIADHKPLLELHLAWSVLCAQVANLPSLHEVHVLYLNLQQLEWGSVHLHRTQYARSLSLIKTKKVLVFKENPGNRGGEARFEEILDVKQRDVGT
jgi:hypothetical protein